MPQWKQFSGNWTVTQQVQAKGAGTWPALPGAPTIGTATAGSAQASVAFTAPANPGYPTTLTYEVTSSPEGITATGSSSPITVTGLTNETSYTFTVTATNDTGTGPASAASNAVIPTGLTRLYAWGGNGHGVLGLNEPVSDTYSSPVQVGALTTWLSIDVWYQALAIKTDETLWAWGRNDQGQLGLNDLFSRSSPVQVGSDTWSAASAGGLHSVAVSSSGELYAAGYNAYGQLGQNNTTGTDVFTKIGSDTNWSKVAAGYGNTFAVKTDGTLWAFGSNTNGSLGIGFGSSTYRRSSPVQIGALTNWLQPSSAYNVTAVVKTNGQLWTWGQEDNGQLGLNDLFPRSSPVQVGALTNWAQVSVGSFGVTGAIKTDGTLWAWGRNDNGQVGNNQRINKSSPVQIGSLTNWAYVSAGNGNMLAVKTDGTLWSWGSNSEGRGGTNDSSSIRRSSPVQVGTLTTWDKVAASAVSNGSVHAITRSDT